MAQCFDGEVTPLVTPFEQRNQACLDIGCGIIAVTQVIPANGGEEFYEDCSGAIVTGTVVTCPPKVLVMNPAGAGGTDVSTLAKEATLGLIKTSADTLVTASGTTNSTLDDILLGQATAANQTTTITAINAPRRSYGYEVSLGNVSGVSEVSFFGTSSAVPPSGEPVWIYGASTYPFPTAAQTLTISSSSANDTALGTGMQSATVKWIDFTTGLESTLVVALNGTTPTVISTNGYLPNLLEGTSYGVNGANVGVISIGYGVVTGGVPANILSYIDTAGVIAAQAIYTVPTGKTFDISQAIFAASGACFFQIREYLFGAATAQCRVRNQTIVVGSLDAMGRDGIISIAARNTVVIQAFSLGSPVIANASIKGFLR